MHPLKSGYQNNFPCITTTTKNVVVCLKGTNVLVLMVFADALNEINENQVMKIAGRKFINIRKIVENLETDVAANLSQIHTVTGFDTTSFLHVFGKIKVL